MDNPLLLSASVIFAAMVGAVMVLLLDKRTQRLERRIAAVTAAAAVPRFVEEARRHSIRVAERRRTPALQAIRGLLQVPGDLPGVHVMPQPVVLALGIVLGVGVGSGLRSYGMGIAVVVGAAAALLAIRTLFKWETKRYANSLRSQMPDMIELLSSCVRAGLPVGEAFRSVARELPSPTRDEFQRVVREVSLGSPAENALMAVHLRTGVPEYGILAVTLGVQSRSGGKLAETIQMLAETIRQRLALASRAGALAAEAKLSAHILTALPFASGAFMMFSQPDYLHTFLYDPRGKRLLLIAAIMLSLGQLAMHRLISGATGE